MSFLQQYNCSNLAEKKQMYKEFLYKIKDMTTYEKALKDKALRDRALNDMTI